MKFPIRLLFVLIIGITFGLINLWVKPTPFNIMAEDFPTTMICDVVVIFLAVFSCSKIARKHATPFICVWFICGNFLIHAIFRWGRIKGIGDSFAVLIIECLIFYLVISELRAEKVIGFNEDEE